MADTATAPPETTPDITGGGSRDTAEFTGVNEPPDTTDPAPAKPKPSRSRPRAMPLLIHGGNATGITAGVAYGVAGVPGLIAAGAAGAAVGAAALVGRKKRSKVSAARRPAPNNRSGGGSGRAGGGAGKGGLLGLGRGGGRGRGGGGPGAGGGRGRGGRMNGGGTGTGTKNRPSGGRHGASGGGRGPGGKGGAKHGRGSRGPGGASSPGANTPKGTNRGRNSGGGTNSPGRNSGANRQSRTGRAWQTVKGLGSRLRRNSGGANTGSGGAGSPGGNAGANRPSRTGRAWQTLRGLGSRLRRNSGGANTGSGGAGPSGGSGPGGAGTRTRLGRALQKMRGWAGRMRRSKKSGSPNSGSGSPASGRFYRMRRLAVRKLGHWVRCAGAGLLAGLAGLLTLPFGLLWGLALMPFKRRDPLRGFALPFRVAGRIWRFFFRRSKARHDKEAKADTLTLKVDNPRKDTDPVTGPSLAAGTTVLDGNTSKFAMAMRAAYSSYTGSSPRSMMEVAAEYAGLPNGIRAAAMAVQEMAVNADQKYPCSKKALNKLNEACARLIAAAARADNMVALFRMAHAFDIERIVAPRTNEWMWNVTPTGADAPEGAMFQPGRIESGCVLMAVLYRTFEPVHMMQVGSEFQGMSYGLTALADCVQVLHERSRDLYPVDDRVTDEIGLLVSMIRAAADDADMAAKLFVEDHHREISHNINPRKGPAAESMWNTPR
ncbi:hypothetical protein [Streptomyces flavofungini]|uniref:hypothetical protein n=1 Tax=Streptomyces flavofungini TaxID=68200 RepID=UPI0025AFDBB5|nr:hypothetical protein [Streptomyces flavofungini]WJV51781.1 hypothetical protein QUY26_39840 [Streptomyces flavofungini]